MHTSQAAEPEPPRALPDLAPSHPEFSNNLIPDADDHLTQNHGDYDEGGREEEDGDIYRGEPPPPAPPPPARSISSASTASTSSSFLGSGRLGAIAAVVEGAINRWAKGTSDSSSSSSSSSSRSSINTISRSQLARRRKRRRPNASTTTLVNKQSEQEISARIRARQEARHVSREFMIYLPPTPIGVVSTPRPVEERLLRTASLPAVLECLGSALKRSTRNRRNQDRTARAQRPSRVEPVTPASADFKHHDYMLPPDVRAPSRAASFTDLGALTTRRGKKGKQPETSPVQNALGPAAPGMRASTSEEPGEPATIIPKHEKAWWLDVSSPTWDDMRVIGKLLHLHPLTLEDILQQDPREKLELFPKLGYYFVVFRAVDGQTTRERLRGQAGTYGVDEGIVGEANVYLVVFREGVCSFHFTDISEHMERVKNRVSLLENLITMSSDWIAHGILDSVVDSFIPFLEDIEKEVQAVEDIVFSQASPDIAEPAQKEPVPQDKETDKPASPVDEKPRETPASSESHTDNAALDEKGLLAHPAAAKDQDKPRFKAPRPTRGLLLRRLRRMLASSWAALHTGTRTPAAATGGTSGTLRRMARTRRLVTSLTRLLATKGEVVAQVRKRLHMGGADGAEVAMYMGDVQDHILTLQHALAHYERMLSQSHPAYLAQLSARIAQAKGGTDKALLMLTIVTIFVLCGQTITGSLSLNITVPANTQEPYAPLNVFGVVIGIEVLALCVYLYAVRRWWVRSKRRRSTASYRVNP